MSTPDPEAATGDGPRPNAPVDDPMPGLGTTIPAGATPEDEALGVEVPATGDEATGTTGGDPLPGGGTIVPVRRPPEDEALGVPKEDEAADRG
jgi:hypothetical protein